MKIISFARIPFRYKPYPFPGKDFGKPALICEIAFNREHLYTRLNGQMAMVEMPAESLPVRIWRWFFPLKGIEYKPGETHELKSS